MIIKKINLLYLIFVISVVMGWTDTYAPGEIVVRFDRGVVDLEPGVLMGNINK